MQLSFILGRAGSGKTTYCLNSIRERLKKGKQEEQNLILLVPEQATFQMEMELAKTPGLNGMIGVQVLSFNRLTWRVLQEVGGGARIHLNELGKNMIISKFLEKHKNNLRILNKATETPGFATTVSQMISELKLYRIALDDLKLFLENNAQEDLLVFDKLRDIFLIYQELEDYLAENLLDTDDYLNLLAEKLPFSSLLNNAEVWIDEFTGFTPQELNILAKIFSLARHSIVSLTLDPKSEDQECGIFRNTEKTYQLLIGIAQDQALKVNRPLELDYSFRFQSVPALGFLEKNFYQLTSGEQRENPEQLRLIAAQNRRAEVEWAARMIREFSLKRGLRYKEMGILLRNFENYDLLLETILADHEIPFFIDRKRQITHHPLIEIIKSALEVMESNWNYEAVFRYLKTDLANIAREDVDLLENYVLAYGIKGSSWYQERKWSFWPRSMDSESAHGDRLHPELEAINKLRWQAIKELKNFSQKLKVCDLVSTKVEALYSLLIDLAVPDKLELWAQRALKAGDLEKAGEHSQIWEKIIDLFDQLVETLGDNPIDLESFISIINAGMETIRLGLIPPGLDQVLIGSLGRSRIPELKLVFVLGVEEGVLPARPQNDGLFDDLEREHLKEQGLELAPGRRDRLFDEQFLVYQALTRSSDTLILSYPLADEEGKALRASSVISRIKELFPDLKEEYAELIPSGGAHEELGFLSHPSRALGYLALKLRRLQEGIKISEIWWEVYNWFLEKPDWQPKLEKVVSGLFLNNQVANINPALVQRLYNNPFRLSVSRLEKFNACPFSYFANYGLALREREIYTLRVPDLGQFFHSALDRFAENLISTKRDWGELSKKEYWELTDKVVQDLAPELQNEILLSSARYRYLTGKFKRTVHRAVMTLGEHARRGKFRPLALEIAFGSNAEMPGLKIRLEDGTLMELVGRIDRLDIYEDEKKYYLRVIDYKSGSTKLDLIEVFYGLKLQLFAYLDIALNYVQKLKMKKEIIPAGVLYFQIKNPLINTEGPIEDLESEKEILKDLKMEGFVLADLNAFYLHDFETQSGTSPLLPVGIKSGALQALEEAGDEDLDLDKIFYKSSKIMSIEEIESLRAFLRRTIKESGERILIGEAQISPYKYKDQVPCSYCSFQGLCQFDLKFAGNEYREIPLIERAEVMEQIKKMDLERSD